MEERSMPTMYGIGEEGRTEEEEYDPELCKFIDRLLRFCGDCVKKGLMEPFEMKHKDPKIVSRELRKSLFYNDICNSYDRLKDHVKEINLFQE